MIKQLTTKQNNIIWNALYAKRAEKLQAGYTTKDLEVLDIDKLLKLFTI